MPDEIKKVLVVALDGCSGSDVSASVQGGRLPSLQRLMTEGVTLTGIVADASPASRWATLATGAHAATHGVTAEQPCQAQYIWQAAEKLSKRVILLGYPASVPSDFSDAHPADLLKPTVRDHPYYGRVAAYLRSSPDWDLAFIGLNAETSRLREADDAVGTLLEAADFETLRVVVAVPSGAGDALAILAGPGVLEGKTVARSVELADLAPTICHLAELPVPAECEGGIVYQALADPDAKLVELQTLRHNYERLRRSTGRGPMC
jgi:hypothetical protein